MGGNIAMQIEFPNLYSLFKVRIMAGKERSLNAGMRISSVQSLSHVQLFAIPLTTACRTSLSITQLPKLAQTHAHQVGDAIHLISSSVIPFCPCLQSFPASGSFPVSSSSHQVAKVLELQFQH